MFYEVLSTINTYIYIFNNYLINIIFNNFHFNNDKFFQNVCFKYSKKKCFIIILFVLFEKIETALLFVFLKIFFNLY